MCTNLQRHYKLLHSYTGCYCIRLYLQEQYPFWNIWKRINIMRTCMFIYMMMGSVSLELRPIRDDLCSLSLSRCRIQFGRWRSWCSTLLGSLFFRWSRLHWFSTAGWGFSWSSAVVFLGFSRPQFSQWLRCSQVLAFSWYVPGNSFAPLWFCSSISSLFFLSSIPHH